MVKYLPLHGTSCPKTKRIFEQIIERNNLPSKENLRELNSKPNHRRKAFATRRGT